MKQANPSVCNNLINNIYDTNRDEALKFLGPHSLLTKGECCMEIKIKKLHEDAVIPFQATSTDAGYDIVAIDDGKVVAEKLQVSGATYATYENIMYIEYRTGIAIEPPPGYHTEIFPRSSISKKSLILANSIGLVDEGYRHEILIRFKMTSRADIVGDPSHNLYKKGDKIAQLVIRKTERANFIEVDELSETERKGGFGSTGE